MRMSVLYDPMLRSVQLVAVCGVVNRLTGTLAEKLSSVLIVTFSVHSSSIQGLTCAAGQRLQLDQHAPMR